MVPVRIASLFPPTRIQVDLYLSGDSCGGSLLYTRADAPPTARDLQALQRRGVKTLYTPAAQAADLHEQFHAMLHEGVDMPPHVHLEVAREAVRGNLAKAWTATHADELVTQAAEFVDVILDVCNPQLDTSSLIHSLLNHDGDTFTHVSNVSVYTLILLRKLGVSDVARLSALGQAALLHDLGKRHIDKDLLRKPSVLTREEMAVIAQHPRLGFEELCGHADLDRDQLLMIYHHHEKLDGTGYPVGLVGDEIHWTGRLCAVVDVFDALTGRRPYRKPTSAQGAVDFLEQQGGVLYDEEFVRCWSSTICHNTT